MCTARVADTAGFIRGALSSQVLGHGEQGLLAVPSQLGLSHLFPATALRDTGIHARGLHCIYQPWGQTGKCSQLEKEEREFSNMGGVEAVSCGECAVI